MLAREVQGESGEIYQVDPPVEVQVAGDAAKALELNDLRGLKTALTCGLRPTLSL